MFGTLFAKYNGEEKSCGDWQSDLRSESFLERSCISWFLHLNWRACIVWNESLVRWILTCEQSILGRRRAFWSPMSNGSWRKIQQSDFRREQRYSQGMRWHPDEFASIFNVQFRCRKVIHFLQFQRLMVGHWEHPGTRKTCDKQ